MTAPGRAALRVRSRGLVLVVDDDRLIRQVVCDELEVALVDLMMPDRSGDELAAILRVRYPKVRTIFISAHEKSWLIAEGHLRDDDVLLRKPFDEDDIRALLDARRDDETPGRDA